MNNRKFGKATAETLFSMTSWPCTEESDGAWIVREDGIHINQGFRAVSPIDTAFDWTPAYDMDWPGSPDPMDAPLLPIPFTANELAACMLDGIGRDIQENLDRRIGYALDADALVRFSLREREVRDALSDAYALAAKAQSQVGELDYAEQQAAYILRVQLDDANGKANEREGVFEDGITNQEATQRRERAIASVADLNAHAQQASTAVKAKWFAWRKAMVRQLLHSGFQAAPEHATAAPIPAWSIKKPMRYLGYTAPLHAQLNAAYREGRSRPTAHEVLEAWRINKPDEIVQALTDGFNYYDSEGNTKAVDLAALRAAINRATSVR